MEKQKTINSLAHNDDFSKALMESYSRWSGGDGFQNTSIAEEEIPTGQKQGGTAFATFDTPIGSIPAPASDAATSIPTIEKQKPDDGSIKDPKATCNGGEPAVALKGSMTMGQGSMSGGVPQTNGQAINYTNVVTREEKESIEEKKAKKDHDGDGKVESGKAEYFGSKDKAIKKAMKKEEAELWDEASKILTKLSELNKCTYTVKGEKWETEDKPVIEEESKCSTKEKQRKKAKKIMGYVK